MGGDITQTESRPDFSAGYALGRFCARRWVNASSGKIRLLRADWFGGAETFLLVLNGPPNFRYAAAVVAAMNRPVRFLLPRDACRGMWTRWIATQLGVIWQESGQQATSAAPSDLHEALSRREAVALFAEIEPGRSESLSASCTAAATMALHAAAAGCSGLAVVPMHVLDAYGESPASEVLIAAGAPIATDEFLGGASAESSLRTLAGAIEVGLAQNPYRLEDRDVRFFLSDLEKVLSAELDDEWASKSNWKQKTEGFEISRFLVECAEDLNAREPAVLGGLRIELERYREELRVGSQLQAEVETSGEWLQSSARRARYWIEALLEAPLAFYGFVNHLLPIALLMPGNLLGRLARKDPGQAWLLRVIVVLGTYFLLVSLCARGWGRAAAGYYALTLPLSGLVLWRFHRLMRTRIRLLLLARTLSKRAERIRRLRKRFLERLNRARDRFAESVAAALP